MSYNGSGTFNINSAGQPVVSGTVISSTAFNALTGDLATGLTTAITKDGQTTPTANIPMGTYKITGLGAGTLTADAVRLSQLQNFGINTLITVAGTDTITGTVSPSLTAYTTGQIFSFVVAATNTGAVTINIDGLGAKAVTRAGTVALAANDMVTGQIALVEYDGTRFQLLDPNAFTNLRISNALTYGGVALSPAVTGTGNMVLSSSPTLGTPDLGTPTSGNLSSCTADGTNTVGFRNVPQNSQSAAYTAVLADGGKHVLHPSADTTARTYTIPANSSVAYVIGTAITFVNQNAGGVITIAITTDTMRLAGAGTTGSRTLAANGIATALKVTSTEWIISGTGLT